MDEDNLQRYAEIIRDAGIKIPILYKMPHTENEKISLLVYGASGELEPYKNPTGVRNRIHRRNMRFLDAYNNAYESYLRGYINKVKNANSLKQLKRLGPPSEPYRFPTPRGAHRREILEIARKQSASSFKAWRAIAERIAEIRKIHPPGTFWLEFKFVHEETISESVGITYKVQIETNLDIDQNGNLITGSSSKLVLQAEGSVRKGNLKGTLQREIDNQGNVKTVAKIELEGAGVKYGFEGKAITIISDFDSLKDVKWEMFDKRYLVLSLELMRKIVKDEDTEGEKP